MQYKDYQNSRDAVWELLIRHGVSALPVSVGAICRREGIAVRYYHPTDGNDGCSMIVKGRPVILVSADVPIPRQRFTAAHELGHVMLGHVGSRGLVNREPAPEDNPLEQAANVFAARLLAPACVLWGCRVQSAEDIMGLCGISHQAAEFRMERMRLLYQRGKFLTSPLEQQVYRQFRAYIEKNRL